MSSRRQARVLMTALLLVLPLIGAVLPLEPAGRASSALQNALHPLGFFLLSLLLLAVMRHRTTTTRAVRYRRFAVVAALLVLIACLTELLQTVVAGRTPGTDDLLADLLGIGAALLLGHVAMPAASSAVRLFGALSGITCLVVALAPVAPTLIAHLTRPDFPMLENGEGIFAIERVAASHGTTVRLVSRDERIWLTVRLGAGRWPGIRLVDVTADWSGCNALLFDIDVDDGTPLGMTLRIDDAHHDDTYADRFNRPLTLHPGRRTVRIPLEAVRRMDQQLPARAMRMDAISRVLLFGTAKDAGRVFSVASVWLEGCSQSAGR